MAEIARVTAAGIMSDDEPTKTAPVPKEQDNVKLTLLPLTKDKMARFESDFPGGVPPYDFKAHSRTYTPDAAPASFELKYSK